MFIKRDKSDEIFYKEYLAESPSLRDTVAQGEAHHFAYAELAQDLFTMLYEPKPVDTGGECPVGLQVARQAIESIKETREYRDLHALTSLNTLASGAACDKLGKTLKSLLPPCGPKSEDNLLREMEACDSLDMPEAKARTQAALDKLMAIQGKAANINVNADDLRQRMRVALAAACKAAEEAEEACGAFGCGNDVGKPEQVGLREKLAMAKRIGQSEKLKQIAKLAGRFTRIAKKKQMQKMTSHEFASVKQGDNLSRTLPREFAKLACEPLRPLFFKGFVEKTLMEYELGGKERLGQGPIICCVDGSSSMTGSPEEASKGIAMALMEIAKTQSRDFILIQFASANQVRVFVADKGQAEMLPLLVELEFFFAGGTNFESPLKSSIGFIRQAKYDKADIIFITDGICDLSVEFEAEYNAVKKDRQFGCLGILIGPQQNKEVMDKFCDEVFNVADLVNDLKNDDAHERVFKI